MLQELRSKAKNKQFSLDERLGFAHKADSISRTLNQDSTVISTNRLLSTLYLNKGDYETFKRINSENLKLAKKASH